MSLCRWLYIYYFFIVEINLLFNILIREKEMIGFTKSLSYRVTQAKQIVIEYQDLVGKKNLKPLIEEAYGSKGLGILFVNGIPNYSQQRKATLPLFHRLANLPKDKLQKYERPQIFYSQGWSCGVQKFQGKYDTAKGSYYVNCASDTSFPITAENEKYFTQQQKRLYIANKWVQDIPEIQTNVKALSKIMTETGALLALHIDELIHSKAHTYPQRHLHDIIVKGKSHVGRMLHYFPYENKEQGAEDDWCGWHNDHGSLTALTSAIYTDQSGQQVKFPIKTGGLYAKNRYAEMARIAIPQEMLAFQLGQSTQILSGGVLQATPHCVVRSEQLCGKKIARNTFALFLEPDPLQVMRVPLGTKADSISQNLAYKITPIKKRWDNEILFKQFHKRTIQFYS